MELSVAAGAKEIDVLRMMEQSGRRLGFRGAGNWISFFAITLSLAVSGTASATVTIHYLLTPDSHLSTSITSSQDFFVGTGETPSWLDGSLGTPPGDYGTDVPQETLKIGRAHG